jgi:ACT domain-containing protein
VIKIKMKDEYKTFKMYCSVLYNFKSFIFIFHFNFNHRYLSIILHISLRHVYRVCFM